MCVSVAKTFLQTSLVGYFSAFGQVLVCQQCTMAKDLFNKLEAYVPHEDIKGKHQLKNRVHLRTALSAHCSLRFAQR